MSKDRNWVTGIVHWCVRLLLGISAVILAGMMFLTVVDVGLRYIFNSPLPGAYEVVEFIMAVFVTFSIVYCTYEKGHIAVDLVMDHFPIIVQKIIGLITGFLLLLLFLLITWQNLLYVGEEMRSNLTSTVLLVPVFPFIAIVTVGLIVLCLLLLIDFFESLKQLVVR